MRSLPRVGTGLSSAVLEKNDTSTTDRKSVISLKDVAVAYDREVALFNVSLDIYPGEFVGICGPNASGKTTLLKTMLGVVKPFQGRITLFGKDVTKHGIAHENRFRLAYVPQQLNIDRNFPASVLDVIMMGRYGRIGLFQSVQEEDRRQALEAAVKVHMEDALKRPIGHLSGGQQQKVLIAQALAQNPDVILMDEPTSALDFKMARSVMELLKEINQNQNLTILTINHNLRLLREFSKRVICINKRIVFDGRVSDPALEHAVEEVFFS
jgi:manganese/zinc/iron transport system ATP- binding protein